MAPLAHLTDAQLDAHLANLDSWLEFELIEVQEALDERLRRGGPPFRLGASGEDYLARRPHQGCAA